MTLNSNDPRESLALGDREDQAAAGSRSVVTVPQSGVSGQQPGAWPVSVRTVAVRNKWQRERARRQLILDSIRAHLEEQPSPRAIRGCARRWADDIRHIADDVITAQQEADA